LAVFFAEAVDAYQGDAESRKRHPSTLLSQGAILSLTDRIVNVLCRGAVTHFDRKDMPRRRSYLFFDPAASRSAATAKLAPAALRQLPLRSLRFDGRVPEKPVNRAL